MGKQVINKCFKLQKCKSGEIYLSSAYNSDILPVQDSKSKDELISSVAEEKSAEKDELIKEVDTKSSKVEKPLIKKDDQIKSISELEEKEKVEKKTKEELKKPEIKDERKQEKDTTLYQAKDHDTLKIVILKGTNLVKTELVGKSDPYIVVDYGDKKFKSKTVKNNQNP